MSIVQFVGLCNCNQSGSNHIGSEIFSQGVVFRAAYLCSYLLFILQRIQSKRKPLQCLHARITIRSSISTPPISDSYHIISYHIISYHIIYFACLSSICFFAMIGFDLMQFVTVTSGMLCITH